MRRFNTIRHGLAALLIVGSIAAPVRAQMERETFTNLKVLPKDIEPEKLRGMMSGFTRALGVRCIYCHVGQEGQPFKNGDFALDDKPTKLKARVMIQMMQDLNEKYLPSLATRSAPVVGGEGMLNDVGYTLLSQKQLGPSVAAFKLNVGEHPASGDA